MAWWGARVGVWDCQLFSTKAGPATTATLRLTKEGVQEPPPSTAASPCVPPPVWILLPLQEVERVGTEGGMPGLG